ncbi:unnamed protein product [Onchocerca flexuosa]|uniref:Ovule protein n=1 Tax=Onchocerca flexuosa TaxID=387005 RepID=A0A183HL45_9BILA|nr:unnamed protein product [Onchocerca flexuosa]
MENSAHCPVIWLNIALQYLISKYQILQLKFDSSLSVSVQLAENGSLETSMCLCFIQETEASCLLKIRE